MLKLKKIEMVGFKSFCDRTEMAFNGGGITAVVGPNGCGKSNLSDAINWVLGEQSAKSLRGGSMQDVIFNGTRERQPTGMSEVSLTLVEAPEAESASNGNGHGNGNGHKSHGNGNGNGNGNGHLVLNGERLEEIRVTRRLFRSGESEYLLNGKQCRLRDIQEIFMGTGLGPESYAIIEQGRIGQILSSKPYDRRALIEEAAGVTKYKTKRRLAEAKLEGSKQNLNRVNDILDEVTRQVNSLKRQAAKARRYEELRTEYRSRLRLAVASRHSELERHAMQLALELGMAASRLKEQSAALEQLELEQFQLNRTGYEQEDALRRQRENIAALAMEADRARNRIAYQKQQSVELETRLAEEQNQFTQATTRVTALEEEAGGCRTQLDAAVQELLAAQAEVDALAAELSRVEEAYRYREQERETLRASLLDVMGQLSHLRNQLTQVEEYLAGLERQRERAAREQDSAAEEERYVREQRNALLKRMEQQQMELASVAAEREAVETRSIELKADTARLGTELGQLRDEYADVRARRDSLDQILSHHAYTAEAVKRLFSVKAEEAAGDDAFRPLGILADFIDVETRFEPLVESFLADELEYVVVKSWDQAQEGIRVLRSEAEGRATFLVHPEPSQVGVDGRCGGPGELPHSLTALRDHVRLTNGLAKSAADLLPKLQACFVAESAAHARTLAAMHPSCFFLAPEGECFHGATVTAGKRTKAGPLALKRELRELTHRATELVERMEDRTAALRAVESETERVLAALERLRRDQVEREKLAAGCDQELKQLAFQLQRAGERLSVARLELERLEHERKRAVEQAEKLRADAGEREQTQRDLEQRIGEAAEAAAELAAARDRAATALAEGRTRAATLEERRRAAAAALNRLEESVRHERIRAAELERQLAFGRQELERLAADNEQTERRAVEVAEQRTAAETQAAELQQALETGRQRLAELEERIKADRAELDAERERKAAGEVTLARQQAELSHMDENCRNELGVPVAELAVEPAEMLTGDALVEIEEQARQLRAKIEALGPVNTMALEEYQEAQQRFDFLNTQRQDLLDAIRDTQQTILEIDRVSKQQFVEAFNAINSNFQETFRTLFGGGAGMMRLSEEDNPGDSGIDMVAQPPGKRLQNVLLLSGGEKALTALALLLAIFRYQPSPFCVLDEVDAPLDDANIGRFTTLLQQMSLQTQFIIITHSKKTMEAAPVLYGVTMQEPGVSKLVSVKFANGNGGNGSNGHAAAVSA